jgi:Secretion system C-terminal sorting domain
LGFYSQSGNAGTDDSYIVKFNNLNQLIWSTYFGGNSTDVAYGCATFENSLLYIDGETSSPENSLAPFPLDPGVQTGVFPPYYDGILDGSYNGFITRFNLNGIPLSIDNHLVDSSNFNLFPNPTSDKVTISFSLEEKSNIKIELIDLFGQQLLNEEIGEMSGFIQRQLQVDKLSCGLYFVKLTVNNKMSFAKFIKN